MEHNKCKTKWSVNVSMLKKKVSHLPAGRHGLRSDDWSFLMHLCYQCFAPLEQKDDGVIIIHRINIPAESDSLVAKRLSGLFPLQRSGTLVE